MSAPTRRSVSLNASKDMATSLTKDLARLGDLCAAGPTLAFTQRGACRDMGSAAFYPKRGEAAPFEVCARCPVRLDCLAWGLVHERSGTWGGASENERRRLRRQLRVECNAPENVIGPPSACGTVAGAQRHYRSGQPPCDACRTAKSEAKSRAA